MKWEGYANNSASWEPEKFLTPDLIAGYARPDVSTVRLDSARNTLTLTIESILRGQGNKAAPYSVPLDLDIYRYLVKDIPLRPGGIQGYRAFELIDMEKFNLPEGWQYVLNSYGVGRRVCFPILMKPELKWSVRKYYKTDFGFQEVPRHPVEKVLVRAFVEAYKVE